MEQNYLLSPARQLTEDEKSLVWQKPVSHVESEAERRICEAVKRNWTRGEMKISPSFWKVMPVPAKHSLRKPCPLILAFPIQK